MIEPRPPRLACGVVIAVAVTVIVGPLAAAYADGGWPMVGLLVGCIAGGIACVAVLAWALIRTADWLDDWTRENL